jgi:hypothetical protein
VPSSFEHEDWAGCHLGDGLHLRNPAEASSPHRTRKRIVCAWKERCFSSVLNPVYLIVALLDCHQCDVVVHVLEPEEERKKERVGDVAQQVVD